MVSSSEVLVIIMAAGSSSRMNFELPKQYLKLGSKTLLEHTISNFKQFGFGDQQIIVAISKDHEALYKNLSLPYAYCFGDKIRQDSVRLALEFSKNLGYKYVFIHDAARCFLPKEILENLLSKLKEGVALLPLLKVADTIKKRDGSIVTIDRENLYGAQTPQGFVLEEILDLHNRAKQDKFETTDDVSLYEKYRKNVDYVPGSKLNFKITDKEDYMLAQMMVANNKEYRIGSGFDVHKFDDKEGENFVMLGGAKIPHKYMVLAHSDGDVALHALMDALLGSISLGDIGVHFPPSDNKWKGIDSMKMVAIVKGLLDEKGAEIINIDLTIMCEAPRVMKHKEEICTLIADSLSITKDRVSIKATTTEGLGFLGRREGIAANCSVMVRV